MKRLISASLGALVVLGFILATAQRGERVGSSKSNPSPAQAHQQTRSGVNNGAPGIAPKVSSLPTSPRDLERIAKAQLRKRAWDKGFVAGLKGSSIGDPIRFDLVAGEVAVGTIQYIQRAGLEVIYVSGELSEPEQGRFFFQKQTRKGVAGDFVGVVEFPATRKAYRIEPSGNGNSSELVERALGEVICLELPRPTQRELELEKARTALHTGRYPAGPIPAYQNGIIALQSLIGATPVIYLDFQGGYTPSWGGVTYAKPDVSNDQIREVFERVAEDFLPFNINVTTDLAVYQLAPEGSRQRVIITPTDFASADVSGIAFFGSFNWTGDNPCWSFNLYGKACAETCSHEAGHTLGLSHQGRDVNGTHFEYYTGQGNGETGWAPIMGIGWEENVSQWAKGEYAWANNQEDALAIITTKNNDVAYSPDDTGDTLATSRYLEIYTNHTAAAQGVIEQPGDVDAFQFTTSGGDLSLRADPAAVGPDLALQVSLYDAQDNLLASDNPQDTLWASLSTNIPPGTYTFRVAGVGRNDPLTNGFSAYGSLGYYSITGAVANARAADRFTVAEHSLNGTVIGRLSVNNPNHHQLTFAISSASPADILAIDNSGTLIVVQSPLLDYQRLSAGSRFHVQIELFVTVTDLADGSLSEAGRRVVVSVTPVPVPPSIAQQPTGMTLAAGTNALFSVLATGTSPLDFQWFFDGAPLDGAHESVLTVTNVQLRNEGNYFVTVSNPVGAATSVIAALSVLRVPPLIFRQPMSQTGILGSNVSFSVLAGGLDPLAFQWQFNSADLLGATNKALGLTNLTFADAGDYGVVVSNIAGVVTSAVAHLTLIGVPPVVLRSPSNNEVYYGSAARLGVTVGGSPPFSYQWRRNGADVPGGTSPLLQLDHVSQAEQGEYSVVVSNAYGVVSSGKGRVSLVQVVAWGMPDVQTNVPAGLSGIVRISSGEYHTLALKSDGTVRVWCMNRGPGFNFGQFTVPAGLSNVVDIAAGSFHNLALRADGTVVAWGAGTNTASFSFNYGQSLIPAGLRNVVAVAAGAIHSVALQADGHVVIWGTPSSLTNIPPTATNLVSIGAGWSYVVGIRSDGTSVAWGTPGGGPSRPMSNLMALAAGVNRYLGLTRDGTVRFSDSSSPGPSNVVQIAAPQGYPTCVALQGDGKILTWPSNYTFGVGDIPPGLTNTVAIASGPNSFDAFAFAMLGDGSPQILTQPTDRAAYLGGRTRFAVTAGGQYPLAYQWQYNGSDLPGATNSWFSVNSVQASDAGNYSVTVTSPNGSISSRVAQLKLLTPLGQSVDAPNLSWSSRGDASWYGQSDTSHDGIGAAQSSHINDNQTSTIQVVLQGPGSGSFWWKVSSEEWFDYLTFTIDGVKQAAISGEVDWQQEMFAVSAGPHVLDWTYSKDVSDSGGLDAAWLDQFTFGSGPPVIMAQPVSQIVDLHQKARLSVTASGAVPLNYQWIKDGTNLANQISPVLSIQNATESEAGIYSVIVNNQFGTNFSSNAVVSVCLPQSASNQPWLGKAALAPASGSNSTLHPSGADSRADAILAPALPAARKRAWDRSFLAKLTSPARNAPVRFELLQGQFASGSIDYLQRSNGDVICVSGKLDQPEPGRFFFQKQNRRGVAGDFVGVVEFPASQKAYRIEPTGPGGVPELVEHPLSNVVCVALTRETNGKRESTRTVGPKNQGANQNLPVALNQNGIISLESFHGATAVIYLDFQGGYTPTWGGVTYDKPDVTNDQILEVFERVAEDFMPFNINVTTDLNIFQHAPEGSRQRVIITPTSFPVADYGGIAYVGSFNWSGDVPCWCFNTSGKACAETCSHELGHTLGLSDMGQNFNQLYGGQGSGDTAWAPIMGLSVSNNVSQWSKGEYRSANNQQDELAVIATQNNDVSYGADDTGDSLATSRYLELYPDDTAIGEGVIERTGGTDAFQFTTLGGAVSLRADPASVGPNLALQVALYDSQDSLLDTNNPPDTLWASVSTNLPAGTYTFRVSGAGRNNPLTNGFSAYGSLGYYSITGSVANARFAERFSIPEHSTNGTFVGNLQLNNPNHHELAFSASGSAANVFAVDNSGTVTVAKSDALDYETISRASRFRVQLEFFVTIADLLDGSLTETNRRVVVTLTPVPAPPIVANEPQDLSVPAGTKVQISVSIAGKTPLDYQWFFDGAPIAGGTDSYLSFTNVQLSESGYYFVTASNIYGAVTSRVANLSVEPIPPIITAQPLSQAVLPATAATFSVSALGTEPFSFQWQFNGTNLPGATNPVLVVGNVLGQNLGQYDVVVSNSAGATTSDFANLTAIPAPPLILKQPANSSAYITGHAHLQVTADGWNPISYQWRFEAADVPGATNAFLDIDHILPAQAGAYSVLVSNSYGVVSSGKAFLNIAQVAAWGSNQEGQRNVPPGLSGVVRVACGMFHNLALKSDGTVTTWAKIDNPAAQADFGQYDVPAGLTNLLDIAAGSYHSLALQNDGTVVAWGAGTSLSGQSFNYGQSLVPGGLNNVIAVAAGGAHSAALLADGHIVVWGAMLPAPAMATNIIAIASAGNNMLALRSDGILVSWNQYGSFPLVTNVASIAAGMGHRLMILNDGSVLSPDRDATPSDLTNVIKVAARFDRCLALQADGTLTSWGSFLSAGSDAGPPGLPQINSIACGNTHSVVVLGDGSPQLESQPADRTLYPGAQTAFTGNADGLLPLSYQWQFNGKDLPGATNALLLLTNVQSADIGTYRLIVTNTLGRVVSRSSRLIVLGSIADAVDEPAWPWLSIGAPWWKQSDITHDGISAAQSGAIGDNQQSSVQTTITGPGTLSFWWKVSSEQWFDFLTFNIDGVVVQAISGEVDWQQKVFDVPAGTHNLTWTYSKDGSDSAGLDAGWLDQVAIALDTPVITDQPLAQIVRAGSNIALSVTAVGASPLNYQWFKNGAGLSGQTLSSLIISNATRHDSGSYAVSVSNDGGSVMSSNAIVRVRVQERFANPHLLLDGSFAVSAQDSDAASLFSGDLSGFTAQVSTNLINWEISTNPVSLENGKLLLLDPAATNFPTRFYRILEQ